MARKGEKGRSAAKRPARPARKAAKPKPKPAPKKAAKAAKKPAAAKPKEAKPKAPSAPRPAREELEEETVCSLEFLSDGRSFIARLDTIRGGMREHKAPSFTDLLELVAEDLREEFSEA